MQEMIEHRVYPSLKEMVVEASRALALLDADRLEELALSCQALNRDLARTSRQAVAFEQTRLAAQAHEAKKEMAVFARVLDVSRANLTVLNRLRNMQTEHLEYREGQVRGWAGTENGHGNN
jgi:Iap family predicted aminopeptidase